MSLRGDIQRRLTEYADNPSQLFSYETTRDANRFAHRTVPWWNARRFGVDVVTADWDTLVILDACRYDLFADVHTLPGELERRQSNASATVGWLTSNFGGQQLLDTVYVSANGQLTHYANKIDAEFHYAAVLHDEWDEEWGTVHPEATTRRALEAHERFPNKRLIVHYIQPHFPFIGADDPPGEKPDAEKHSTTLWEDLREGLHDVNRAWDAYRATYELAEPHVADLLDGVDGRTVVSSDHGNMFGERAHPIPMREYGHPDSLFTSELVDIPWLVHDSGARRDIQADDPVELDVEFTEGDVADRLRQLGYR